MFIPLYKNIFYMPILNYRKYADLVGVTATTILKRIRSREISAGVGVEGNRLVFTIDTSTYPPEAQRGERRGRPRNKSKTA